jgi:phosphoglycerol transferase
MYPTMLELVGVNVKEHRAGIGVSALADENDVSPGSILDLDSNEYRDVVKSRSVDFYAEIWADDPQAVAAG